MLYWCIQEPRYVGVGIAWCSGSLMDVGDATLFGQHALAYAVLAYAAEYFRRRVLRFPLWQQAAQVARAAAALRGARAAGALRRRRAAAALDVLRAAARRRAAVAAALGAAAVAAAARRARRRNADASPDRETPRWPAATLFTSQQRRRGDRRRLSARRVRNPERELFLFRRRLVVAGVLVVLARSAGCSARFVYLQVFQHDHYQTLAEIEPHRDRADRAQPRRHHRPQRRRARAELLGVHARDPAVAGARTSTRRSTRSPTIVDIQPRDRKRFRKLLEESKNFESLPLRTRLTDEEVARFAVNRYRFPGVEIKARLFRQYPYGEVASHVIGYIGRINDRDLERIGEWDETANYKGSDYIGKVGVELSYERELHGTTGVEEVEVDAGGPRGAHAVAHAAGRRQQPAAVARHQAAGGRRGRVRRPPRRAGRDRARAPATCSPSCRKPGFDPNLFVDGIDPANWEVLNESPDKPLLNRPLRGAYPPGSTIKPFLALGALTSGKRTATQTIFDPGFFQIPGRSHRFRDDKPGGHGTVDMYKSIVVVLRHVLLHARQRDRHRRHARVHVAARLRPQDRHRHRGRAARRAAVARMEARSASPARSTARSTASGTSATRSRPASGRATTRSRRCSSRTRSRPSPTTASPSGRTSCKNIENVRTGEVRAVARRADAHAAAQARAPRGDHATRWSA